MVKSMVEFANLTNIQVIAEGIECEEELKTLLKLGVHNGQGYFLRKPNEELKPAEKDAVEIIKKFHSKKNARMKDCSISQKEFRVNLFRFSSYKRRPMLHYPRQNMLYQTKRITLCIQITR